MSTVRASQAFALAGALILLILVGVAPVAAVPVPAGPEFPVNTTTADDQYEPTVAVAADGRFVVVWTSDGQDGDRAGVFARRFAADGTPLSGEFQVNTVATAKDQQRPAVAMAPDGRFVIVWTDFNDFCPTRPAGWPFNCYAALSGQRYAADGTPAGGLFRVDINSGGGSGPGMPAVAMAADGRFVVAWSGSGTDLEVYARRYDSNGVPQGIPFVVNTTFPNWQIQPAVAIAPDGRFVIAWESQYQDPDGTDGVYARRYAADGSPVGGEFRANTTVALRQLEAAAAMGTDGRFVIAWRQVGMDGAIDSIYAQRYTADGAVQGGEFRVDTTPHDEEAFPALDMDAEGGLVATWLGGGGVSHGVYGQRYAPDGSPQDGEFRVNTGTSYSPPSIGMAPDGRFVVVWHSFGQDGSQLGVFARRYLGNVAPVVGLAAGVLVYQEGSGERAVDPAATVADPDSATFAGGTLTAELLGGLSEDRLGILHQGSDGIGVAGSTVSVGGTPIGTATGLGTGGPLVVQLNANATVAATQALLRVITYENLSLVRSTAPRTVRITLSDGDGRTSAPALRPIQVVLGTVTAGCFPRPPVQVRTQPNAGRLVVTVTSTPLATGQANAFDWLKFDDLKNARVIMRGQVAANGQVFDIPDGDTQATFTVERSVPGQATTVHFSVADRCDTWKTFVGGGPSAGF